MDKVIKFHVHAKSNAWNMSILCLVDNNLCPTMMLVRETIDWQSFTEMTENIENILDKN